MPTDRASRVIRWLAPRLLLAELGLLACFVVGEVACRLPAVVRVTGGTPTVQRYFVDTHEGQVRLRDGDPLRIAAPERPVQPDTKRVLTVGDSFTWGDRIWREEDTWPRAMQRSLAERNIHIDVIDVSSPGKTMVDHADLLTLNLDLVKPDIIILQFTLNDPLPTGKLEQDLFRLRQLLKEPWIFDHSYLYHFLNTRFATIQMTTMYPDGYAPLFAENFPGWQACRGAIGRFAETARRRDLTVLFVIFPDFSGPLSDQTYKYKDEHARVARVAREADMQTIDLRQTFAEANPNGRSWWALPWDHHPNVAAHALAGKRIAADIASKLRDPTR